MEVLHQFGSEEQKARWLDPLLAGEIRSGFAMTEPDVASSDATNISLRIEQEGRLRAERAQVVDHRRTASALRILIVMGKTDTEAPTYHSSRWSWSRSTHRGQVLRSMSVFGYRRPGGPRRARFADVRVPAENIIAGEGMGFMIAQARLGPGRIHHCMRAIGPPSERWSCSAIAPTRARRLASRCPRNANIRDWIAESRIELEMARLLVLKTAWLMDTVGNQRARIEVAAIKVAVPNIALKVVDRAIQVHGGGGVSQDFPLAYMYAGLRTLRLADGPDEVHKLSVARQELRRQRERRATASPPPTSAQAEAQPQSAP